MSLKPIAQWTDAVLNRALPTPGKIYNPKYRGANFSGSNLSGATMTNLDLSGCDFSGANLAGADLRGSLLHGAKWDGAVIDHVLFGNAETQEAITNWENLTGKRYVALTQSA